MPIYEYKCKKCHRTYELFQGINDPEAGSCIYCQGTARKLISLSSFHLKGTGWYVTDYGGKKCNSSGEGKKEDSPCGAGACEGGSCES